MDKDLTIAIDGYAGCGKSTTAKALAQKLGYIYIDSGAMYRAITLYFLQHNVNWEDPAQVIEALENISLDFEENPTTQQREITLNGVNVEQQIRTMQVSQNVSQVSIIREVRQFLVTQQRKLGKRKKIVMDGRDIGTVVFPDADLKIFMTASMEVRAERRRKELEGKNQTVPLETIKENLRNRDYIDSTRKESPLKKAEEAVEIDTSNRSIKEQVEVIMEIIPEL